MTPVPGLGLGGIHSLEGGGNKLSSQTYERVGDAGGWNEVKARRTALSNVVGRIETVEVLESGNAVALQLLLTDETQHMRGRFKSYTIFVKTDILQKNTYFSSVPPETFRELAARGFETLQGKKLAIERAKIFDKEPRVNNLRVNAGRLALLCAAERGRDAGGVRQAAPAVG
jgi:hypothetical protein